MTSPILTIFEAALNYQPPSIDALPRNKSPQKPTDSRSNEDFLVIFFLEEWPTRARAIHSATVKQFYLIQKQWCATKGIKIYKYVKDNI